MNVPMRFLWLLYLLSVTLLLLVPGIFKGRFRQRLPGWLLAMVFPFVGLFLALILPADAEKETGPEPERNRSGQDGMRSLFLQKVGKAGEIIPLDDAIRMNAEDIRRRLLMLCLKEDAGQYVGVLKKALAQDDQETAHYAAAAVMELKSRQISKLMTVERRMGDELHAMESDGAEWILRDRDDAVQLERAILSDLFDRQTVDRYRQELTVLLDRILRSERREPDDYRMAIRNALGRGETASALALVRSFRIECPENELAWLLEIECTYVAGNGERLLQLLDEVKHSTIRFSREMLGTVRFWQRGLA